MFEASRQQPSTVNDPLTSLMVLMVPGTCSEADAESNRLRLPFATAPLPIANYRGRDNNERRQRFHRQASSPVL